MICLIFYTSWKMTQNRWYNMKWFNLFFQFWNNNSSNKSNRDNVYSLWERSIEVCHLVTLKLYFLSNKINIFLWRKKSLHHKKSLNLVFLKTKLRQHYEIRFVSILVQYGSPTRYTLYICCSLNLGNVGIQTWI